MFHAGFLKDLLILRTFFVIAEKFLVINFKINTKEDTLDRAGSEGFKRSNPLISSIFDTNLLILKI